MERTSPTPSPVDRHALDTAGPAAERALRAPLRAVRVLVESMRSGADREPLDRILHELLRAERAAEDLTAWALERPLRPADSTLAEVAGSLDATLDPLERTRCHLVVEGGDAPLRTDARLLVEALLRAVRGRLDEVHEVMVHAHTDGEELTITLVDAPDEEALLALLTSAPSPRASAPRLSELLLERDCARLGGRASVRVTGGHRCAVLVLPNVLEVPSVDGDRVPAARGEAA